MARNPSAGPGWPKIGSNSGNELGELGLNGTSGVMVDNLLKADYPCAVYLGIEDLLGISW